MADTQFTGTVLSPRLAFRHGALKNIVGYIRLTTSERDPAYMFNVQYSQEVEGAPIGLVSVTIYDKVFGKDLSTVETLDINKLYNLAHNEKNSIIYTRAFNADKNALEESGNKVEFGKPYANALELWLNQIFLR